MLTPECLSELRAAWLPHMSDSGLARLIDLLDKGSPLLISGAFTRAIPMGCLASHIGWHHPRVCHRTIDAGILWLTRVAGLNPATSHVIRVWDSTGPKSWPLREELAGIFREERNARQTSHAECAMAG